MPGCRSMCSASRGRARGVRPRASNYAAILRRLAAATGGRYLPLDRRGRDLAEACRSVIDELRSRYVLGFPTAGGESRWRRLEVRVRRRGVEIRSRAGYHGPPPATVEESVPGRKQR